MILRAIKKTQCPALEHCAYFRLVRELSEWAFMIALYLFANQAPPISRKKLVEVLDLAG